MPGPKDLNYRITVDQSAGTAGVKDFSRTVSSELRKVDKSFEDTGTAAQRAARLLGTMADAAETELGQAKRAADALALALGPEMAAKLGANGIAQQIGDLNRMGVTFDEITTDADELAAAIKRVDQVQTSAAEQGLGNLTGKITEADGAARGANSALANMIGNSAQDLGALSGVAGSAGVAIGQIAEYASDASLAGEGLGKALGAMATVAGPIAALAAVTQLVSDAIAAQQRSTKAATDDQKRWTDAMNKGGDAAENYADALREAGEILVTTNNATLESTGLLGKLAGLGGPVGGAISDIGRQFGLFGKNVEDLAPQLERAGLSVENWTKAVMGGPQAMADLEAAMKAANTDATVQIDILEGLETAQENYGKATAGATEFNKVFGDSAKEAARAQTDQAVAALELANAQDRAERKSRDLEAAWDSLTGKLDTDQALLNVADRFDEMRTHGEEAWGAVAAGAEDADQKVRDYQGSVITAKDQVIDLGRQLGLSVPEVKRMLLEIDNGNLEEVERELDIMARNRTMNLSIIASGGQGYVPRYGPGGSPVPTMTAPTRGATRGARPAAVASAPATAAVPDIVFPLTVAAPTGPTSLTVDMRGAILGSRYDITRTVRTAVRDGVRLAGTRGLTP